MKGRKCTEYICYTRAAKFLKISQKMLAKRLYCFLRVYMSYAKMILLTNVDRMHRFRVKSFLKLNCMVRCHNNINVVLQSIRILVLHSCY